MPRVLRRAVVCAIVRNDAGHVLLHQRSDNGKWSLPGGAIDLGETATDAVRREVLEETGFAIDIIRLSGIYSMPAETTITYPEGDTAAYVALAFACRSVGGPTQSPDAESLAVAWFDPANLPATLHGPHRVRIEQALTDADLPFLR